MDIGVRIPCYRRWCRAAEVKEIAVQAEAQGFASLWVQDHLVAPVGPAEDIAVEEMSSWMTDAPASGQSQSVARRRSTVEYYAGDDWWLEPFVTWGFIAAVTSRVRLASDIIVVPYRNAVVQAKMLGTLDVLSDGRMMLGTGTGHVESESRALGVDYEARARMHDEYLRVIKAVLSNDEVEFHGEFHDFGPTRTLIRSVQRPHPPIYVGGNSKRAIRRAAELGDGWLPSSSARDGLRRGIEALHEQCELIGRADIPKLALSALSVRMVDPDAPLGHRPAQHPDELVTLLAGYEALGVDHLSLAFPMPSAAVYLRQMDLFAKHVLPAFLQSASSK